MLSRIRNAFVRGRILPLLLLVSLLASCDEGPSQNEGSDSSTTQEAGLAAIISGAYEGEVSGVGVLKFLPEAGFDKQGYVFLADGQGIRSHGVTFVLPRGLAPGKHALESPSPLNLGTVPSVRVDRDMGDAVRSSDRNTSGTLDLSSYPDDEQDPAGSEVAGRFEFETEDPNGQRITVKGSFSFTAE